MLGRDHPKLIPALAAVNTLGPTCSTGFDQYSGTEFKGRIIDRLGADFDSRPLMCSIGATIYSTVGSTEADQKITLAVLLEHGASSGGGDMADYLPAGSTGPAATITFATSALTTPEGAWSTADKVLQSNPGAFNLQHAEQFIRIAITATLNAESTTTSPGADTANVYAGYLFHEAQELPWVANSTAAFSTSTSTST